MIREALKGFHSVYSENNVARWVELSDQSFKVDENTRIARRPKGMQGE